MSDDADATNRTGAIDPTAATEPDPGADLDESERARIRRRDRDADAERRALMNSGSAKWFKQVLDHQAKVANEPTRRRKP